MDRPLSSPIPAPVSVRVGATSWRQPDWMGTFYPVESEQGQLLSLYARHFSFVEASQCADGFPSAKRMRRWIRDTPADFRFALPVPRAITHDARLEAPPEQTLDLLGQVAHWLGGKLAFFRLGIPGDFTPGDLARLDRFLKAAASTQSPCPASQIVIDAGETGFTFDGGSNGRKGFADGSALIETVLGRGASLAVDDRMVRPSPILAASPVPCINLVSGDERLEELDRAARRLDGAPGYRRALPGFEQDLRLQRWAAIIQRLQSRPRPTATANSPTSSSGVAVSPVSSDAGAAPTAPAVPSPTVYVLVDDGYEGHAPTTVAKLMAYLRPPSPEISASPPPARNARHLRLVGAGATAVAAVAG